jgi:hypothetical protein
VRAVIGADFLTVPGFATPAGLTGAGQTVAIADSGLDRGRPTDPLTRVPRGAPDEIHPDLASTPGEMPKVPLLRSWSGGGTADPVGHGTHVAATVAWTDPPAAPGAARTLVNDLNLTVTAPDGRVLHGNHFLGAGRPTDVGAPDEVNNIERVFIARPQPGTYTVTVRAARVAENTVFTPGPASAQDFALVFGCLPVREVALGGSGNILETAGGGLVELPRAGAKNLVDGVRAGSTAGDVLPGADLYLFGPAAEKPRGTRAERYGSAYAVSGTWRAPAVKTLDFGGRTVFAAINPLEREGGRSLAPQGQGAVWINGAPGTPGELPPGVEIAATVNPSTQTLWRVEAFYRERDGLLAAIDPAAGEMRLVGDTEPLRIASAPAVSIDDIVADGCWLDRPFGAFGAAELGELRAGMTVHLVLSALPVLPALHGLAPRAFLGASAHLARLRGRHLPGPPRRHFRAGHPRHPRRAGRRLKPLPRRRPPLRITILGLPCLCLKRDG